MPTINEMLAAHLTIQTRVKHKIEKSLVNQNWSLYAGQNIPNRTLDIPEYSMKERKTKTSILQKLTSREDEINQKQARAILL